MQSMELSVPKSFQLVNIFIKISSVSAVLFLFIMTNSLPTSGFAIFYYFIHYRILSAAIEVFSNVLIQLLKDHFLIPLCLLFSLQTLYLLAECLLYCIFFDLFYSMGFYLLPRESSSKC